MNSFSVLSMALAFPESGQEEICKILNSIPWKTIDKRFNMYECVLWCPEQGEKQNRIPSTVSSGARAKLHIFTAWIWVCSQFLSIPFQSLIPSEEMTYLLASWFDALLFWNVRNWNLNWKCGQGGEHWIQEEQGDGLVRVVVWGRNQIVEIHFMCLSGNSMQMQCYVNAKCNTMVMTMMIILHNNNCRFGGFTFTVLVLSVSLTLTHQE